MSKATVSYLEHKGICLEPTAPYTPQQNGKAESLNRVLLMKARPMLLASGLDHRVHWWRVVMHANWLRNRSPYQPVGRTPYEGFYGTVPDVSDVHVFGGQVCVTIPKHQRGDKFMPTGAYGKFLGIDGGAYTILLDDGHVIRSRDVRFTEATSGTGNVTSGSVPSDSGSDDVSVPVPVPQPAVQPAVQPALQPAVQPVVQPAVQSAVQPPVQPTDVAAGAGQAGSSRGGNAVTPARTQQQAGVQRTAVYSPLVRLDTGVTGNAASEGAADAGPAADDEAVEDEEEPAARRSARAALAPDRYGFGRVGRSLLASDSRSQGQYSFRGSPGGCSLQSRGSTSIPPGRVLAGSYG